MLLYEIREKLRKEKAKRESDPNEKQANKDYIDAVCQLFDDRDAIREAPRSMIYTALCAVGYDIKELPEIYDNLIKELSFKIVLVDPEMVRCLEQSINEEKANMDNTEGQTEKEYVSYSETLPNGEVIEAIGRFEKNPYQAEIDKAIEEIKKKINRSE